jgi:8-hydroxy-5-deazaflavin:NADPH oxidoreductase
MTYAILGAGNIGSAIARQFARKQINVLVANQKGPESLSGLVNELGSSIVASPVKDALRADVVILAIPFTAVAEATRGVEWGGRIVVDATNAIDFPAFTPTDLGGRPSTEVLADALPGARLVKAFNTLPTRSRQRSWPRSPRRAERTVCCSCRATTPRRMPRSRD